MLSFLPKPLVGIIAFFLYGFFSCLLATMFFILLFIWFITPIKPWRRFLYQHMINIPSLWSEVIRLTMWLTTKTKFTVTGLENVNKKNSYLLIANHQTWLDVLIMQRIFDRYTPQLRYFMKQELIWVPIIGQACWLLGYPFMKRHSVAYLKKHPEHRNKDIETTRKACERFRNTPITLINYVEGTRVSPEKQKAQKSPYRYLLKPKAGGISLIMSALRGQVNTILNVTIVYGIEKNIMWNFLQGNLKEVIVHVELISIPESLLGDYQNDPEFKARFQQWLNHLWTEKDQRIAELKTQVEYLRKK
jgi:1-acyl-sn-glycerol-3-phosphate acyltransferase